ncbi:hypothetical protein, partial [Schlesneria paludicola]
MIVFDIRTDDCHSDFIARVNRDLESEAGKSYLARFGPVCSPQWWACFDRGEFRIQVQCGLVTHVGPRINDVKEEEDVIEIDCAGSLVVIDRVEHWA